MIDCACLVARQGGKLLLVRVRDNQVWYFPGGKIDPGETPEESLSREVQEELGLTIRPASFRHIGTVEGENHDRTATARLRCYEAALPGDPVPAAEISELAWLDPVADADRIAPLVMTFVSGYLTEA